MKNKINCQEIKKNTNRYKIVSLGNALTLPYEHTVFQFWA